jgi:hypothetical protein
MTGLGFQSLDPNLLSKVQNPLPSWALDYSLSKMSGIQLRLPEKMGEHEMTAKVDFDPNNPRVIKIEAAEFDVVEHLAPAFVLKEHPHLQPNLNAPTDILIAQHIEFLFNAGENIRQCYNSCRQLARQYSTAGKTSQEAADQEFWNLLMSNELPAQDSIKTVYPVCSPSARKVFEFFAMVDLQKPSVKSFVSGANALGISNDDALKLNGYLMNKFNLAVGGKIFCISKKGSMGLVPALTEKGDEVAHIRGGYMLGLLRRKNLGENRGYWVGPAYLHLVEDHYYGTDWKDWFLE